MFANRYSEIKFANKIYEKKLEIIKNPERHIEIVEEFLQKSLDTYLPFLLSDYSFQINEDKTITVHLEKDLEVLDEVFDKNSRVRGHLFTFPRETIFYTMRNLVWFFDPVLHGVSWEDLINIKKTLYDIKEEDKKIEYIDTLIKTEEKRLKQFMNIKIKTNKYGIFDLSMVIRKDDNDEWILDIGRNNYISTNAKSVIDNTLFYFIFLLNLKENPQYYDEEIVDYIEYLKESMNSDYIKRLKQTVDSVMISDLSNITLKYLDK